MRYAVTVAAFAGMSVVSTLWLLGKDVGSDPSEISTLAECANPRKTRVKVGATIFDLPMSTSNSFPLASDDEITKAGLGLLAISRQTRGFDRSLRFECNGLRKRVADYGSHMGFAFYGSESDFRAWDSKRHLYNVIDIWQSDKFASYDPTKIFDGESGEEIRLKRTITGSGKDRQGWRNVSYEFTQGARSIFLSCYMSLRENNIYRPEAGRSEGVFTCGPNVRFKAGELTIGVGQRYFTTAADGTIRAIPPEDWPLEWRYVLDNILSYRLSPLRKPAARQEALAKSPAGISRSEPLE